MWENESFWLNWDFFSWKWRNEKRVNRLFLAWFLPARSQLSSEKLSTITNFEKSAIAKKPGLKNSLLKKIRLTTTSLNKSEECGEASKQFRVGSIFISAHNMTVLSWRCVVMCRDKKGSSSAFFNHCPFFEAIVAPSLVIIMEERHIMNGDSHLRRKEQPFLFKWGIPCQNSKLGIWA